MFRKLLPLLGLLALLPLTAQASGEVVYLANCAPCPTDQGCKYTYSTMPYYPDASKSNHLETPATVAYFSWVVAWEGNQITGTFPDQNQFTSFINSNAASLQRFQVAGFGENHYRHFTCYKDKGELLYKIGADQCYSIYYCT